MELFKLLGTIAVENADANRAIDDTTNRAESSSNRMVSAFKKIGAAVVAAFAVDKVVDFGKAIVGASAEVAAEEAAFTQIMGTYSEEAANKVSKIAEATGMVDSRLTPYMTSMTAKFKGLGYDVDDATDLASQGLNIAADAAAFWDKSLDDSMSALNSFVNGNYEGGEAIGLFANETTLATWASENLGLTWKDLTEKEKQFARLQFAKSMQEASGATGQASKEAGAYANVQGNLNEAWRQFKAQAGEPLLQKIVIPAMKWLGDFITNKMSPALDTMQSKLKNAYDWFVKNKEIIEGVVSALGILAAAFIGLKAGTIIQNMATAFGNARLQLQLYTMQMGAAGISQGVLNGQLTLGQIAVGLLTGKISLTTVATELWRKAQTKLNAVLTANPIGVIVMAIAALIAILVVAYNKSDAFKQAIDKLWKLLKDSFMKTLQELKPYLDDIVVELQEMWKVIQEELFPVLKQVIVVIMELWTALQPILEEMTVVGTELFATILGVIKKVLPIIIDMIKHALTIIKNVIQLVTAIIKGDWSAVWTAIKNIFISIWESIKNATSNVWNIIKALAKTIWTAIKNVLVNLWKGIKTSAVSIWNGIKSAFSSIWNAIKNAAVKVWTSIKNFFVSTWNGIKNTASNVVNGVKNAFVNAWNTIKNKTTSVWNKISSAITTPIRKAKDKIQEYINKIKGFFSNFKTNIKLPHFKIKNASWNPKDWMENGVPKLSVEWYKDGAVMTQPTAFGYNPSTNSVMVGGEAGDEAVAPIDTLMSYVQAAVKNETSGMNETLNQLLDLLTTFLPQVIKYSKKQVVLNNGVLVGELAPEIDEKLGNIYSGRGRGR